MKVVINKKIWCELDLDNNICHYKFYPKNIPVEYGGDDRECVLGSVICESAEEAEKCMHSIKGLIYGGYEKDPSWLFSLDIGDIINHILCGGEQKFLQISADIMKNMAEVEALKEKMVDYTQLFCAITLPCSDEYTLSDCEQLIDLLSEGGEIDTWIQLTLSNDGGAGIDLWY